MFCLLFCSDARGQCHSETTSVNIDLPDFADPFLGPPHDFGGFLVG